MLASEDTLCQKFFCLTKWGFSIRIGMIWRGLDILNSICFHAQFEFVWCKLRAIVTHKLLRQPIWGKQVSVVVVVMGKLPHTFNSHQHQQIHGSEKWPSKINMNSPPRPLRPGPWVEYSSREIVPDSLTGLAFSHHLLLVEHEWRNLIRLTHANVWESMGKPCSCTEFIKSRILHYMSGKSLFQYQVTWQFASGTTSHMHGSEHVLK